MKKVEKKGVPEEVVRKQSCPPKTFSQLREPQSFPDHVRERGERPEKVPGQSTLKPRRAEGKSGR